jgi:rRNA-processing protein FCF1
MQIKVLLDTNFLIAPIKFKIDLFEELKELKFETKLHVLDESLREVQNIDHGIHESTVKKMIDLYNITIIKTTEKKFVDDLLLDYGKKGYAIATNDRELKKRLDLENIPYICMRQKRTLEFKNFSRS